jgi:putative transposase
MRTLSFSSLGSWYFASTRHGGSLSWCILGEPTSFRTNVKRILAWFERAAMRFLTKAIHRHGVPKMITIDGSEANKAAIKRYNEAHGTTIDIRQIRYRNNMVEQDHRAVKRIMRPILGFKSCAAAQAVLVGIELMQMLKRGPLVIEEGAEGLTTADQFDALGA